MKNLELITTTYKKDYSDHRKETYGERRKVQVLL